MGDGPIVTTARALLTPPPSRETRVKSELIKHESLEGAIGLKITGDPELTKVVPGTGILVMHQDDDVEDLKEECMKDIANLSDTLATEAKGVTAQASTLGALEDLHGGHHLSPGGALHAAFGRDHGTEKERSQGC